MIVPSSTAKAPDGDGPPLALYTLSINYADECGFWGVTVPDDGRRGLCEVWTLQERNELSRSLKKANEAIQEEVNYPIWPRWLSQDNLPVRKGVSLRHGRLLDIGQKVEEDVQLGVPIDYDTEPATLGPFAAPGVASVDEVCIFHPGSDVAISPSGMELQGGQLWIAIPRCRLVKLGLANNPLKGYLFSEIANFETQLDIKRLYTGGSQGTLFCKGCSCNTCVPNEEHEICVEIVDPYQGIVNIEPVDHHALCNCKSVRATVNYRSGLSPVGEHPMDVLVRLAHSQMAKPPCGCGDIKKIWERDRIVPEFLSRERQMGPFGPTEGAWFAYQAIVGMTRERLFTL